MFLTKRNLINKLKEYEKNYIELSTKYGLLSINYDRTVRLLQNIVFDIFPEMTTYFFESKQQNIAENYLTMLKYHLTSLKEKIETFETIENNLTEKNNFIKKLIAENNNLLSFIEKHVILNEGE